MRSFARRPRRWTWCTATNISGASCPAGCMARCCRAQTPSTAPPPASSDALGNSNGRPPNWRAAAVRSFRAGRGSAEMGGTREISRAGASTTRERITSIAAASEQRLRICSRSRRRRRDFPRMHVMSAPTFCVRTEIAGRAVERVRKRGSVDLLKDVAARISEVVKSINVIASQTDLLALNARSRPRVRARRAAALRWCA